MITWIGWMSHIAVIVMMIADSQYGFFTRGQLRILVAVGAMFDLLGSSLLLSTRGL
jgi:hypothetical protein